MDKITDGAIKITGFRTIPGQFCQYITCPGGQRKLKTICPGMLTYGTVVSLTPSMNQQRLDLISDSIFSFATVVAVALAGIFGKGERTPEGCDITYVGHKVNLSSDFGGMEIFRTSGIPN